MAPSFAVIVAFTVREGTRDRFVALVRDNAATSVKCEPGCRRFDVVLPDETDVAYLYEIYDDRAAFDAHLSTSHFREFDARTRDLVVAKSVVGGALFENAGPVGNV